MRLSQVEGKGESPKITTKHDGKLFNSSCYSNSSAVAGESSGRHPRPPGIESKLFFLIWGGSFTYCIIM